MAPNRWDLEDEYKLMLAVVAYADPKLPSSFFESFVQKLGKDISANAA